jgi:hypothetical protein
MSTKTAERPTTTENITVLQVGKYGVRIDEKTWFGVNEPLTPSHFVPNEGYKVAVSVSKTGKKYINEILGQEEKESAPAASAPAPDPVKAAEAMLAKAKADAAAKAAAPATSKAEPAQSAPATTAKSANPSRAGFGQPLTDYDMKIQRQISRAGIVQAVVTSPILGQWAVNATEYVAIVKNVSDQLLEYVNQ